MTARACLVSLPTLGSDQLAVNDGQSFCAPPPPGPQRQTPPWQAWTGITVSSAVGSLPAEVHHHEHGHDEAEVVEERLGPPHRRFANLHLVLLVECLCFAPSPRKRSGYDVQGSWDRQPRKWLEGYVELCEKRVTIKGMAREPLRNELP